MLDHFFFCSLKSFLNGDSSGNIYYLYDEIIVSILVEIFFFSFSLELSSLLEGFLQIWVGFTCFPTVWIVFVHFFTECFAFLSSLFEWFCRIQAGPDIFSPVVWEIFLHFFNEYFILFRLLLESLLKISVGVSFKSLLNLKYYSFPHRMLDLLVIQDC